jgi:hypothetical protein
MFRKQYSFSGKLLVATALALVVSGVAIADDNSASRFGGDGYAYFNQPMRGNAAVIAAWRQDHPNGLSNRELQAASSSSLAVWQLPSGAGVANAQSNIAQASTKATSLTRK